MNWVDRIVAAVAPERGLRRAQARAAIGALMHYDAAGTGRRTRSLRPNALDADAAADRRDRLAFVARDMVRNNPIAARAQSVITSNTVGDGIIPSLTGVDDAVWRDRFAALTVEHFDTTAIDADGLVNLYGLQRLVMNAVAGDGEALIRVRRRRGREGLALPFQLQLLEQDYLDASRDAPTQSGGLIRNGIEYDRRGRRVAYHLYDQHPGSLTLRWSGRSRRVPASEVIHVYRPDRPGQQRGVTWFAPVAMQMQDLADYLDAQLVRQKIAACFAGFRVSLDAEPSSEDQDPIAKLKPGLIHQLAPGEDIRFAEPPAVSGLDEFSKLSLRAIASGLGLTYEALSGDLSQVNFSSARMGRMEMDRNVSAWQWLMLIPQMMDRIGGITLQYWRAMEDDRGALDAARVAWTPPARVIVDPTKEIPALQSAVRAGFRSWQDVVRSLGHDPEDVARQIAQDAATFDQLGITLDSDARFAPGGGAERRAADAGASDD